MILIAFLISLLAPTPVLAGLRAPDFQVQATPQNGSVAIVLSAPLGFHFNLEAPHSLQADSARIPASRETETELDFQLKKAASLIFSAYLCDDRKTFCEKHTVKINWDGKNLGAMGTPSPSAAGSEPSAAAGLPNRDEHGFYINQAELAFSDAAAKKLPVMIDFYGIWCPPCNELNETVFGTSVFRKQAKNFILLKMDADSDVSWKLKDQYKIQGYPTLIFTSPSGDEISRVVGYREADLLAHSMKEAFSLKNEPFARLKERADQGDRTASDKVAQIYLDRAECPAAEKYFQGTTKFPERLIDAEIGALSDKEDPASKKLLIATAQNAITKYPHSPSTLDWYSAIAKSEDDLQNTPARKQALQASVNLARELLGKLSSLKGFDLTQEDLLESIAENLDDLNDPQTKQAWKQASLAYQKKIHSSGERGYNLENAYCLWKSGDEPAARLVYENLRKQYPAEFTFHYAEARMEMQLEHLQLAEPLAQTAFENSYGDNKLRATLLFAQILKKEGKTKEAQAAVSKTLAQVDVTAPEGLRTNRHLKALRDFAKD